MNQCLPSSPRRLRRRLAGKCHAFYTGILCMAAALLMLPLGLSQNTDAGETVKSSVIAFLIGLVITLAFSFRPVRALSTVRRLRKYGELELALADLGRPDVFPMPTSDPDCHNYLGQKFIFVFSTGRIIRYYQISSLELCRVEHRLQFNVTDSLGKTYSLAETNRTGVKDIARCAEELRRRYPGWPGLSRSDEEAINI